jgi:hypothetical protein
VHTSAGAQTLLPETIMHTISFKDGMPRRNFLRAAAMCGAGAMIAPHLKLGASQLPGETVATNIADALKVPRTAFSMPGKYPGCVVEAASEKATVNGKVSLEACRSMLERSMLELTGASTIAAAWHQFVSPQDMIGLKVNPIGGKQLSTSLELTQAIIEQLQAAGIPKNRIVIWDRREFELEDAGFTKSAFPDIRIYGTECKDEKGSFVDGNGKLYSMDRIDKDWYYWADCEEKYTAEDLPYMINEGKHSYFGKIVTQELTKIINVPILKNAGPTVTLCLKNLAYGAISNTGRLHKPLWAETCAQVPCFAPLRDKVVLNIVDGCIGCYNGGPGADPQYFTNYNTLLVGTDPVAVDRIGYDIVLKKRLETKVQKQESPRGTGFMALAESYKLGISDLARITRQKITI